MRFNPHQNFYRTLGEREGKGRGKASADERVRGLFVSLKSSHEPHRTHLFTVQQIHAENCSWPRGYSEHGHKRPLTPNSVWWNRQPCQHRAVIQPDSRSPQEGCASFPGLRGGNGFLREVPTNWDLKNELIRMLWATSQPSTLVTLNQWADCLLTGAQESGRHQGGWLWSFWLHLSVIPLAGLSSPCYFTVRLATLMVTVLGVASGHSASAGRKASFL